jgi:hypothetical protein
MSWRAASGREVCNRCRAEIHMGASIYVGEVAAAFWCESCALEVFGKTPGGEERLMRELSPLAKIELEQGFESLRAKANRGFRIVERDWTGER